MADHCKVCDGTGCCPTCEGRGAMPMPGRDIRLPCSTCFGTGECQACAEECETQSDYKQPTSGKK
jgi:hypothetical protein